MSMIQIHQLTTNINACTKCQLHTNRTKAVPGMGSYSADIMFIGEAPGADEDRTGQPFVGRAGQILQDVLRRIGFAREHVFIANTVKCRPPDNRDPTPEEKQTCSPYLKTQIELIKPLLLVPLGRVSMEWFLPDTTITKARGKLHKVDLPTHLNYVDAPKQAVFPVYHPAYAARGTKYYDALIEDIRTLPNILATLREEKYANRSSNSYDGS